MAQAVPTASPTAGGTGLQQAGIRGAGVQHCLPGAQQGRREPLSPSGKAGRRALGATRASQCIFAQWAWHAGEPSISARAGLAAPAAAGHRLQVARNAIPIPAPAMQLPCPGSEHAVSRGATGAAPSHPARVGGQTCACSARFSLPLSHSFSPSLLSFFVSSHLSFSHRAIFVD